MDLTRNRVVVIIISVLLLLLILYFDLINGFVKKTSTIATKEIFSKNLEQKETTKFIENQQNATTTNEFFDEFREIIETSTKTSLNGDEETIFIPDIEEGVPRPEPNKSANQIFFTETTNIDGGPLILNAREACAVESAAIFHPNRTIFVIFTGPTYKNNSELIEILHKNYPNIHFRSAIFENITSGSPLEGFTKFRESTFLSVHVSDALRLVLLWKYGGLFLDLDIVVLKPFDALNENFVCRAANNRLQSGTLDFSGKGIGKKVSQMCLEHLRDNFDPKLWNSNGPDLIMAVMKRICKVKIPDMNEKRCQGMKVLAKNDFLPLGEAKQYIDQGKNRVNSRMRQIQNAYTIHVYSHILKKVKIKTNSDCVYTRVAKKNCPKVFESLEEFF